MLVQYFGVSFKYVYGVGLIGEEESGEFYTYHYDYCGSTVAITDESEEIVLTAEYDVYGSTKNLDTQRMFLLGYCAKYGVITDPHGLCYMRARYYCPDRRRFLNPDVLHGNITDSTSLNRYAYVNGNPVSLVDPLGLSAEIGGIYAFNEQQLNKFKDISSYIEYGIDSTIVSKELLYTYLINGINNAQRPSNIPLGVWNKQIKADLKWVDDVLGPNSAISSGLDIIELPWLDIGAVGWEVSIGINENIQNGEDFGKIAWDATVDTVVLGTNVYLSSSLGAAIGSFIPVPVLGTIAGVVIGAAVGYALDLVSHSARSEIKNII